MKVAVAPMKLPGQAHDALKGDPVALGLLLDALGL